MLISLTVSHLLILYNETIVIVKIDNILPNLLHL